MLAPFSVAFVTVCAMSSVLAYVAGWTNTMQTIANLLANL